MYFNGESLRAVGIDERTPLFLGFSFNSLQLHLFVKAEGKNFIANKNNVQLFFVAFFHTNLALLILGYYDYQFILVVFFAIYPLVAYCCYLLQETAMRTIIYIAFLA